jgi:glucose-6-phosphate isomerase
VYKDGPRTGLFLQITGAVTADVDVPGRPYSLGTLQLAQAFADLRALRSRGHTVVRLHLRDRAAGLARLEAALGG